MSMRVVKHESYHRFDAVDDEAEIIVVGGRRSAYLWVGPRIEKMPGLAGRVYTFSGAKALRALARAILREVPVPRKKATR